MQQSTYKIFVFPKKKKKLIDWVEAYFHDANFWRFLIVL